MKQIKIAFFCILSLVLLSFVAKASKSDVVSQNSNSEVDKAMTVSVKPVKQKEIEINLNSLSKTQSSTLSESNIKFSCTQQFYYTDYENGYLIILTATAETCELARVMIAGYMLGISIGKL